jgi:hypothetical protein
MKWLREHSFIATQPGPSGDFHYVLLLNPNVAVEWMKSHQKVQTELYGRFLDRLASVGGFKEIDAIRVYWAEQKAAAEAAAAAAAKVVPPPVPPKAASRKPTKKSTTKKS